MTYLYNKNVNVLNANAVVTTTNPFPVTAVSVFNSGGNLDANKDAFGRLRISNPVTLFDSFHRYQDNGNFATAVNGGSSAANFNANQGLVDLTIGGTSGDYVYRESKRVFAYQPGKSLLIFTTFVMSPAVENLRQRVGYYGTQNGFYLELNGSTLNVVKRSYISGSVVNTAVAQSSWNLDPLDGTGPSGITLDITKAQILAIDMEWLGVGSVRMGFVINGQTIYFYVFHHANVIGSTYITTACLPLRLEIENTGTTNLTSTLKQICSTVISEGGYEIRGRPRSIGTLPNVPINLTTAGTFYPVVSIRLKANTADCIVIPTSYSVLGVDTGNFSYRLVRDATITGGAWVDLANSNIEYNITGSSMSGGTVMETGFFASTNQSTGSVPATEDSFRFQLERDSFANTYYTFTLAVAPNGAGDDTLGSINWQEIT